jgi:hypothetical protein
MVQALRASCVEMVKPDTRDVYETPRHVKRLQGPTLWTTHAQIDRVIDRVTDRSINRSIDRVMIECMIRQDNASSVSDGLVSVAPTRASTLPFDATSFLRKRTLRVKHSRRRSIAFRVCRACDCQRGLETNSSSNFTVTCMNRESSIW